MASKYAEIVPGLKPERPDAARQERLDAVKDEFGTTDPLKLADIYVELRADIDNAEELAKALKLRLEAVEQMLVASQDAGEKQWGQYGVERNALRLASGATIRVVSLPIPVVVDKAAYRKWCDANGYGPELMMWPTKTAAIMRERLEAGEQCPTGIEARRRDSLTLTKAKS